jgi:hypothetical protein
MKSPLLVNGKNLDLSLNEGQRACIELLEETLDVAQEGKVFALGIVVCMDGGYATVMAGRNAGDLNLGCDSLKRKIIDAIESGQSAAPSKILRL